MTTRMSAAIANGSEFAGKAALIVVFAMAATHKAYIILALIQSGDAAAADLRWMHLIAHVTSLAFLLLIVATTFVRHRPLGSAQGLEPRLSALAGTFLAVALTLLPPADNPPPVTLVALGLSALGAALSTWILLSLGRSFSVMPQARRLVTTGPYAVVRHPLYCAEELIAIGLVIMVFSPWALLIGAIHWGFQVRRMVNEEVVLERQFPEYAGYRSRTPMFLPYSWLRHPRTAD